MTKSFVIGRWLFFRGLALSYLFAFASLGIQIKGLYGERGILPVAPYLEAVAKNLEGARFWKVPTIFWLGASDSMLSAVCWIGALAAIALLIGAWHRPLLLMCWFLFLSISTVGRDFLAFQWDILLLEVGLASLLIAPPGFFPKLAADRPPPRLGLLVLNVVLFKLMFSSGFVKLSSGDETWRSLTALLYHYETQPLPTWIGWYAHQLPEWFQRISVIGVFWIQLAMPIGIFLPRPVRLISASALLGLQGLIALTGNYCYFNLLAVSLILLVIDDAVFARLVKVAQHELEPTGIRRRILLAAVSLLLVLNALTVARTVADDLPDPVHELLSSFRQFRSVSGYGLFAVMTTVRREIVIEGSNDGRQWLEYQLPHQPGPLDRAPSFVAPHQPRLDWQMWFAALGSARHNLWFGRLMLRLLEGSDDVRSLFAKDPFPEQPPRFIRARFYRYWFSDFETKRTTGRWWERELIGDYLPAFSLEDVTR